METFLERLLLEVAALAVQLAIMRIVAWVRDRSSPATTSARIVAA
jgi:hypothetical protein